MPSPGQPLVTCKGGGVTVIEQEICWDSSCVDTLMLKLDTPGGPVGVPVITLPLSVRPAGRPPPPIVQEYGGVPPVAVRNWE